MRVSLLTPVGAGLHAGRPTAGERVAGCRVVAARAGVVWEWVVCADGGADVRSCNADRIVGWRARRGAPAARNAALAAATGDWAVPLDADDELDPVGFGALLTVLTDCEPSIGWVGANRVLLDGGRTAHWFEAARAFAVGELSPLWSSPFPFHPNSWLVRRDVLAAAGGWPSTGVNEDLAAVLLVSEAVAGRVEPAVLTRYRVWDAQEIASAAYAEDKAAAFAVERETTVNRLQERGA